MLQGIRAKVIAAIILVLVVTIVVSVVITVRNQRANLLDSKRSDLVATSSIVNTAIRNTMLPGEAPIAVRLLEELRQTPGFERLELYRRDGTAAFSDYSTLEKVNEFQSMMSFERTPRLEAETLRNATFDEVVATNTPRQVESLADQRLRYYFPILNYQECRQCHGTENFVQGVAFFELSLADVFGRINTARNTLIGFYAVIGILISGLLIQLMQRIVIRPLAQVGQIAHLVGEGNLDVRADVTGSREFQRLSQEINGMISGLQEKNRLEVQNRVIEARDEENRKYLNNIGQGLLLINRDRCISQQYSRYVEELFGTSDVTGRTLSEFIYGAVSEGGDASERTELDKFVDMVFENTATDMEMIMSLNPLADKTLDVPEEPNAATPERHRTRRIVIDADFQRILDDDGAVENVMVIFDDKTDIVAAQEELESERRRYKTDIEHIATLLRAGPDTYRDFEGDTAATLTRVEGVLGNREQGPDARTSQAIMRDLHSLKGTARYLEFSRIAEVAHATEELFSELEQGRRKWDADTLEDLENRVSEVKGELQNLQDIYERFQSFVRSEGESGELTEALDEFVDHIGKMAREIAEELEKDVDVQVQNDLSRLPQLSKLRNPLIHLVRNAIDHGIEDQFERLSAGKDGTARLTLRFTEDASRYRISITDDGRGLDFDAIRRRAVDRGLMNPDTEYSESELLKVLFQPSFSTRDEATEISGRGVGLDVVREEIRALGGGISVATQQQRGTRFTVTLPKNEE